MIIKVDKLTSPEIKALLQEHHLDMLKHSPAESVHALDLSALKADNITFWSAWINNELAGCGALKALSNNHGEIKSMRTAKKHLRKGVAAKLLQHILTHATALGFEMISLETGTADAFMAAQKLYRGFGFKPCPPFADYKADPYSLFLTKTIKEHKS